MGFASRLTSRTLSVRPSPSSATPRCSGRRWRRGRRGRRRGGAWSAAPHDASSTLLTWFAGRCWVLPEEYCGFLGDDFWFILVFSFAWFDSGYMYGVAWCVSTAPWHLLASNWFWLRSTDIGFFWETTSGFLLYPALLGLTVDTYVCQFTEGISHIFIVKVDTILRSISDTRRCVSLRSILEEFPVFSR